MMPWDIADQLAVLESQHLRRRLRRVETAQGARVVIDGRELLNFSSNDYLGLANDERLKNAFIEGVKRFGVGSGASRLVCGSLSPHDEFETALAAFKGTEAALSFSSGFAAAVGCIPALVGSEGVIILDKLCHASLVDAARLSGATIRVFPHNHLEKLEKLLQSTQGQRVLVVTESVFSMDGDTAAVKEIIALKGKYGAWLMLDEAHAVGVLGPQGRGLGADLAVDIHMGTMSKAMGLSGGYIAAKREVIDLLINRARSFIYSTAPAPALAHAASAALKIIASAEGDALRARLHGLIRVIAAKGDSAIVPIIVGDEGAAMQLSAKLLEDGYLIPAIRYPTVARGSARLRLTLSAAHELVEVERLAAHLRRAMA
jgi:8-amino-7-oxononanoate synthase